MEHRHLQPELMDNPELDVSIHRRALHGLRRVNWLSRTDAVIWKALVSDPAVRRSLSTRNSVRILDLASGSGYLAIRLAARGRRAGLNIEVEGCDISRTAVEFATAQAASAQVDNVRFFQHDVMTQPLSAQSYDVVMCSLFLHHLTETDACQLLQVMKTTARELVLVDDLLRTRMGYWLALVGARLASRCHVVHKDGPMSVEGAFTADEALQLAKLSGLAEVTLQTHWPQRFLLIGRPAT